MSTDSAPDDDDIGSEDDKILARAKKRFHRCEEYEATARVRFVDDIKFANGDAYNGYQWPTDIKQNRDVDSKPCLTVNKVRQHNLQIINDARQNKPSIKVIPTGGGATKESADVFEDICRHIEYISSAQGAYDTASRFQVQGGIGYLRIVTDYAHADTFDQEIFIRRVKDPLSIYIDPDIIEVDGSDAKFGFVFDDMAKEAFDQKYPKYKDKGGSAALGNGDGWIDKNHVRVAEYYYKMEKKDKLVFMVDKTTGEESVVRASKLKMAPEILKALLEDPTTKTREIVEDEIRWCLIIGDEIAEKEVWPGKFIPLVRVVGEETVIDGVLDRKGHTRAMIDAQRMYNYWTSEAVTQVALQNKTPWIAPDVAIEGLETYWASGNVVNHAVLPYNHRDETGQIIPPPVRINPPTMATAYVEGMKVSSEEIMAASGQYQAELGMPSNERSGKAINERQRQGDNATYHYIDHLARAIRYLGKQIIDLIPKIYDTPRVIKIIAEDGSESDVRLDPQAQKAYAERQAHEKAEVERIFNPNVGKYEVEADVGPSYGTRRQEAFNAYSQILAQNKEAFPILADLMFRNADFPGADDIAERMQRMLPPQARDDGENPEMQAANAQIQNMRGLVAQLVQQLAEEKKKTASKDERRETEDQVDVYKAITERMKVLLPTVVNSKDIAGYLHDLAVQEHRAQLDAGMAEHTASLAPPEGAGEAEGSEAPSMPEDQESPIAGARRAPDGHWYLPDPHRPGKYLMVAA